MQISCGCAACGARFKVTSKLAGSKARCPKCQAVFQIPVVTPPPVTQAAPLPAMPVPPEQVAATAAAQSPTAIPLARPIVQPVDNESVPLAVPITIAGPTDLPTAVAVEIHSSPAESSLRKSSNLKTALAGGTGLAACLAILAGLMFWLASLGSQTGTVIIEVPTDARRHCALFVNGSNQDIPSSGPLEIQLPTGPHKIELRQHGYKPVMFNLTITARQRIPLTPNWKIDIRQPVVDAAAAERTYDGPPRPTTGNGDN